MDDDYSEDAMYISDEESLSDSERSENTNVIYATRDELYRILQSDIILPAEWYMGEYKKILRYGSHIGWDKMMAEYKWSDPYFVDLIYDTKERIIALIEEYSTRDNFSIGLYYELVIGIIAAWEHYYEKYIKPTEGMVDDLADLMGAFGL